MKLRLSIVFILLSYTLCFAKVSLNQMISQMMIVEFEGQKQSDIQVKKIKNSIANDEISGVLVRGENISLKARLRDLIRYMKGSKSNVFIAFDDTSALLKEDGFSHYPNYKTVANEYDIKEAKNIYDKMANEIKNVGINYVLSPRLNRGKYEDEETFSSQTGIISTYANVFISSFKDRDILLGLKYFPSKTNSTWEYESLRPFYDMIQHKKAKSVIVSCVYMKNFDEKNLSCTSKKIINSILKEELKFDGLIIADLRNIDEKNLNKTAINAINSGVNMLILNHNPKNLKSTKKAILQSIWDNITDKENIKNSYKKIIKLKQTLPK